MFSNKYVACLRLFLLRLVWWHNHPFLHCLRGQRLRVSPQQGNYLQGPQARKLAPGQAGLHQDGGLWLQQAHRVRQEDMDILWHAGVCGARDYSQQGDDSFKTNTVKYWLYKNVKLNVLDPKDATSSTNHNIRVKNPAYGRHWISLCVRIVSPIPFIIFFINKNVTFHASHVMCHV